MAHNIEPMEIDSIENELEDKENFHHGNFVSKTPCTEKGYEELNVSELNMKLRYSITPASSPMSKSVTINCTETKNYDRGDNSFFNSTESCSMSKSLNSTVTINDTVKPPKTLPLQPLPADHLVEGVKQVLRPVDSHIIQCVDIENSVSPATIDDENFSLPSSSSSVVHTPEATTPTKEMSKQDGSPILRGLKSVLSMFRTSQSPVNNEKVYDDLASPSTSRLCVVEDQTVTASTPISAHSVHSKVSPFRESIVFKDYLEKELQWKDDTTIIFSHERIPAHKLFPHAQVKTTNIPNTIDKEVTNKQDNLDNTTMSMDISLYYNDSSVGDVTMTEHNTLTNISTLESDNEFVDCETTFKEESLLENNTDQQCGNVTKTVDEIKENKSETSSIVKECTSDMPERAECELSRPADEENKNQSHTNNDDTIYNSVSNDTEDIVKVVKPDCFEILKKRENHTDSTQDIDDTTKTVEAEVMNRTINQSKAEIDHVPNDQNTNPEHVAECQANITICNQPNTSEEHPAKNTNQDEQVLEMIKDDMIQISQNQYETATFEQEIAANDNAGNEEAKEFGTKELDDLELLNYDMSMTMQTVYQDNDTTINVISNIDTIVKDNIVLTAPNETPKDVSDNKQELKISSDVPINTPLPNLDDFNLLNDSTTARKLNVTQDKVNASITDISDDQCEVTMNNKTILSCTIESTSKEVSGLTGCDIINSEDRSKKCKLDNLDKIMGNQDKTIECSQNFELHESKVIYENQSLSNLQVDPSEDPCCREKSICEKVSFQNYSPVKEVIEPKVACNVNAVTVIPFETIETINTEEEIILSENNSPYVSLSTNVSDVDNIILEHFDETVIPLCNETKEASSPPISSKIQSKGYNFNFDEIDDPFATKTKIRLSPPLDDVNSTINIENKSQVKTYTVNKRKSLHKKQIHAVPHIISAQDDDFKENLNTFTVQESQTDTDPTKVIYTAPNFNSLSSSTFDITHDSDTIKSKEDLLFDCQNAEKFSSTTFNITIDKSDELEIKDLQGKLDSTALVSDTHSQTFDKTSDDNFCLNLVKENNLTSSDHFEYFSVEPTYIKDKTLVNTIVTDRGDSEKNKEESRNNLDTFSCTTFNITTDALMDEDNLQFDTNSATVCNDKANLNTTTTFDNNTDGNNLYRDKMMVSDQSAYFSATPSSTDSSSKNVFNIPEINETFTSSAAVKEIQQPNTVVSINTDDILNDSNVINNENNSEELNCTNSSKATDDKNNTVREINTEDEDTMEGPFLESEDFNVINKEPDNYNQKQDMIQFMDLNQADVDENPEDGEIFIDAKAFEFLLNQNITNSVSDCGKESLFLKFDPLFAKRVSSAGVITSCPKNEQNTPNNNVKPSTSYDHLPKAGTSSEPIVSLNNSNPFEDKIIETTNCTTKPTMVVTPAVNSIVSKNQTLGTLKTNRHSIKLTSPAIAVIDRLLSISGNNSLLGQDTMAVHNEQPESELNFSTQLNEILAEKTLQFQTMQSESSKLRERLSVLESQVDKLEKEGQTRLDNINALNKELAERTKENRKMAAVVDEFEKTIASLIAERVQEKKQRDEERKKLIQERDEQIAHLTNMECSFNDLHSKYEKSKQIIIGFKTNEDAYKKTLKDFEENLAKMQNNYELLKQHATSKLNHANEELEKNNKMHAAEVLKLKAMFKRKELDISSLEESLAQKTKANDELTKICDELINKVGGAC